MKIKNPKLLITSLIIPQLFGFVGSLFTTPAIDSWYSGINRPFFAPPNWLFAPVWILLFTLMGISFYLLRLKGKKAKKAVDLFWTQLAFNLLWSIIFFGLKLPWLAFIEIIILWYYIFITIKASTKINRFSGYLLFPYLLWVSFATLLNLGFALIN